MKGLKFLCVFLVLVFAGTALSQNQPATVTDRFKLAAWVRTGTFTFTNKTLTSPTLTSPTITGTGAITASTFVVNTSILPDAVDGAVIGSAAAEWSDLYLADGGVINFGNDQDVTLTHIADAGLLLNSTMYLSFRDNALKISSSADGQLDIDADTEVEIATTTLDLNGALDISGATIAGGIITANAGVTMPTASTHLWNAGGPVVLATSGTDVACSDGARYWVEIMIPYNVTLTGLSYLVGSVGATDSVVVQLCSSAGAEVATSRAVGTAAVIVGTAAQFQSVAFSTPYAATAGLYYAVVQFNGTTAKFRAYPVAGSKFIAGTVAGTWGTKADITPGTTFTADKGPIVVTY